MADNERKPAAKSFQNSKIVLDNRTNLSLTGVEKIIGSNDSRIVLIIAGSGLTITGAELHVSKLDVDQGLAEISGTVSELKYSAKPGSSGFLKKIFK